MEKSDFPIRRKLTKKLLMRLPAGVFLVSNCYTPIGYRKVAPVFYEKVRPLDDREDQWQRIKAAGANGRICAVYWDIEDYKRR